MAKQNNYLRIGSSHIVFQLLVKLFRLIVSSSIGIKDVEPWWTNFSNPELEMIILKGFKTRWCCRTKHWNLFIFHALKRPKYLIRRQKRNTKKHFQPTFEFRIMKIFCGQLRLTNLFPNCFIMMEMASLLRRIGVHFIQCSFRGNFIHS